MSKTESASAVQSKLGGGPRGGRNIKQAVQGWNRKINSSARMSRKILLENYICSNSDSVSSEKLMDLQKGSVEEDQDVHGFPTDGGAPRSTGHGGVTSRVVGNHRLVGAKGVYASGSGPP